MPKPRHLFVLTLVIFFGVLIAKAPQSFTTQSQKTYVTITIHPNKDIDQDNNQDDQDNENNQSNSIGFLDWLRKLFR